MYHIQKLKTSPVLKWVLVNFIENSLKSSKAATSPAGLYHVIQSPRFYSRKAASNPKDGQTMNEISTCGARSESVSSGEAHQIQEAQDALLEYLHHSRSLEFTDAENISCNSPLFLEKLLRVVMNEVSVRQSVAWFLRYHPINEFEPFFESMGLNPCEYSSLLPRNLMFLSDDKVLLQNYHVFCQYGFAPNKTGKIYKEVGEVFRYDDGVLLSRLQSLQDVVLDRYTVIKLVESHPSILTKDGIQVFRKFVEELKTVGILNGWIVEHLLGKANSYDWNRMLELLCLFRRLGCNKEQLGGLLSKHPTLVLKNSGTMTISIIGFLVKFGASKNDILPLFLQFPQVEVQECISNLRHSYHFLAEIEMDVQDVAKIFCAHPILLGSYSLKSVKNTLNRLNTGKKRLCEIIKKNPQELKNLVRGMKVKPLPASNECTLEKTKFLLGLGFVENSSELKRALKRFRGRAGELQERFNCLVNSGFDQKDVVKMLKVSPQVINQTKEVIEMKVDFLKNDLGYPLSSLAAYSLSLSYSIEKVKLRIVMYNWLQEQGAMKNNLALSTILACSDKQFIRDNVNRHPKGIEVWETLKKQIYSDSAT